MSRLTQLKRMLSSQSSTYHELSAGTSPEKRLKQTHSRIGPTFEASKMKPFWSRLPVELRQSIIMTSLEEFLDSTQVDWKAHLKGFDHAVRTIVSLEDPRSHSALWPLRRLRNTLVQELALRQTEVAQVSEVLTKVWSRWTEYSLSTAPMSLQREATENELIKYRAHTRLKRLEDLEEVLLRAIRVLSGLATGDKQRLKYLSRRKYTPSWRPALLRQEELAASLNGRYAIEMTTLVSSRSSPVRLPGRSCPTHKQLDSLNLFSGFRLLFEVFKSQIKDIEVEPYAACCTQIC